MSILETVWKEVELGNVPGGAFWKQPALEFVGPKEEYFTGPFYESLRVVGVAGDLQTFQSGRGPEM